MPEVGASSVELTSPDRFVNRELSWLAFNRRVLEEAQNRRHPVLERLRFLSISASNLDEFYMVRVAGLKGMVTAGIATPSDDGHTPAQQLARVEEVAGKLIADQQAMWPKLRVELREAGITVIAPEELTETEAAWLEKEFREQIFPVLTPLALDPAHPFPFVANRGFGLALQLERVRDNVRLQALIQI
ncbi:MAG: RNA degradosome polyphosphate kinase, partial [Rhizomicrobium sp.]